VLFVSPRGGPHASGLLEALEALCGGRRHHHALSPHKLRHSFATTCCTGRRSRAVQQMLGMLTSYTKSTPRPRTTFDGPMRAPTSRLTRNHASVGAKPWRPATGSALYAHRARTGRETPVVSRFPTLGFWCHRATSPTSRRPPGPSRRTPISMSMSSTPTRPARVRLAGAHTSRYVLDLNRGEETGTASGERQHFIGRTGNTALAHATGLIWRSHRWGAALARPSPWRSSTSACTGSPPYHGTFGRSWRQTRALR